jgi:hypothetical protein
VKNKAKLGGALAAAVLAIAAQTSSAMAITFTPNVTNIDFGNVLVGDQRIFDLIFNADAAVPFGTNTNPSVSPFPPFKATLPFANCSGTSCLVKIIFAPGGTGEFNGNANVVVTFGQNTSQTFNVPLTGFGVVPIPGALPLFLTGLGGLAYLARPRRKLASA